MIKNTWTKDEIHGLFQKPMLSLLFEAQTQTRTHFPHNQLQASTLLSLKTGKCSEDCAYCAQSAHHSTKITPNDLLDDGQEVLEAAKRAKSLGAIRFCMATSGRNVTLQNLPKLLKLVETLKGMGLELCASLGKIDSQQAQQLKESGLDYYNHNLDTSESFYGKIVSTHSYGERLATLQAAQEAGLKLCSGGILGLGESLEDRVEWLQTLANLPRHPESVPINALVPIPGTPLAKHQPPDALSLAQVIAVARIMMPTSWIRLAAGRSSLSDEGQALCFLAGANAVFFGEQLLTTPNTLPEQDQKLFTRLGLKLQLI